MGINITNNLAALKYFYIATAIKKYLCLASFGRQRLAVGDACSLYLFLAKKQLIEVAYIFQKSPIVDIFAFYLQGKTNKTNNQ